VTGTALQSQTKHRLTERSRGGVAVLAPSSHAHKEDTSVVGDQQTMLSFVSDTALHDPWWLHHHKLLPFTRSRGCCCCCGRRWRWGWIDSWR